MPLLGKLRRATDENGEAVNAASNGPERIDPLMSRIGKLRR
jgi:hypothetical protein